MSKLEHEFMDDIAKEIQKEMDEGIMSNILIEKGWTPVQFYFKNNKQAVDITHEGPGARSIGHDSYTKIG